MVGREQIKKENRKMTWHNSSQLQLLNIKEIEDRRKQRIIIYMALYGIKKTPTRKIPTHQTPPWKIPTQKIPTWNIPTHVFKYSHPSF